MPTIKNPKQIFLQAGLPILLTLILIPLTFFIPWLDSTREPFIDLTGNLAQTALFLSETGGKYFAPVLGVLLLILMATRKTLLTKNHYKEFAILFGMAIIFAGGGAAINEHLIKEKLKTPRPNIIWLTENVAPIQPNLTAEQFYQTGDKAVRSQLMQNMLTEKHINISPAIKAHWITETGYSFPSGHSFSAMFFASFFLLLAVTYLSSKRIIFFYCLLPWALAVCYSRTLLQVHTPIDISIGALQGVLIGVLAWFISRKLISWSES